MTEKETQRDGNKRRDTRSDGDLFDAIGKISALRKVGHNVELTPDGPKVVAFDTTGQTFDIVGPAASRAQLCRLLEAFTDGYAAVAHDAGV